MPLVMLNDPGFVIPMHVQALCELVSVLSVSENSMRPTPPVTPCLLGHCRTFRRKPLHTITAQSAMVQFVRAEVTCVQATGPDASGR